MSLELYDCIRNSVYSILLKVYLVEEAHTVLVQLNQLDTLPELIRKGIQPMASFTFRDIWNAQQQKHPNLKKFASVCAAYYYYKAVFEPRVGQPITGIIAGTSNNSSIKQAGTLIVPHASSIVAIIEEIERSLVSASDKRMMVSSADESTITGNDASCDKQKPRLKKIRLNDMPILSNSSEGNYNIPSGQEEQMSQTTGGTTTGIGDPSLSLVSEGGEPMVPHSGNFVHDDSNGTDDQLEEIREFLNIFFPNEI